MMPTIGLTLAFGSASCVLYALTTGSIATLLGAVLLVGGPGSVLQARLMDVARDARRWRRRSTIPRSTSTGAPPSASGWIGAALPIGGLVIWSVSWWLDQRR